MFITTYAGYNHSGFREIIIEEKDSEPEVIEVSGTEFSRFSGQFVEDGRDELVENVAAMLVTNETNRYLDLATLVYEIDGKTATFVATGLHPGKSAWVMEESKMKISANAEFVYKSCTTSFKDNVTTTTDEVSLTCIGNMLTATNNTEEKLESVYAYYKVKHSDGNYFGGITYLADFGDLEPGTSVEVLAGHFSLEDAEIVRIGWKDS